MSSGPWRTNAYTRMAPLLERRTLDEADVNQLLDLIPRLVEEPFGLGADRDRVGEFYLRVGPSVTSPGHDLVVCYRIDAPRRTVDVVSFSIVPTRQ